MEYKLEDLIDIPLLHKLQENLNKVYPFPSTIIDKEGKILSAFAMQDICTKFYMGIPGTNPECRTSNLYSMNSPGEAGSAFTFECPHGLTEVVSPIIIDGKHLGHLVSGQFFLNPPDPVFHKQQAAKYGFDESEYLGTVEKTPVWTQEKLTKYIDISIGFIDIIAGIGLKELNEIEAHRAIKEREEQQRIILQTAMDGYMMTDLKGQILEVNGMYCQMSGYSEEELRTMHISDLETYEMAHEIETHIQYILEKGTDRFESRHRRKDGSFFYVSIKAQYTSAQDGLLFVFLHDITERKLAEDELLKSKQIIEGIINAIPARVFWKDKNLVYAGCNKAFANDAGFSDPKDIIGKDDFQLGWHDRAEMYRQDDLEVLKSGKPKHNIEEPLRIANGSTITLLTNKTPLLNQKGEVDGIIGTYMDITERKQSELILQDIIEKNPMSIQIVDLNGYTLKVNPAHTELFGAIPPTDFSIFDDLQSKSAELARLIGLAKKGEIVHFPDFYYNVHDVSTDLPDKPVWIHAILFPINDTNGNIDRFVLMHENISWRKKAEEALRASEQKYRVLVDNSFEGIVIIDLEGKILFANNSILKTFEYDSLEEIIGQNIFIHVAPEYVEKTIADFTKVIQGNVTEVAESCGITSKGNRVWLESIGKLIDYQGNTADMISVRDVTKKKKADDELIERNIFIQKVLDNLPIGLALNEIPEGKAVYMNKKFEEIYGWTAEEITSIDSFFEKVYPDENYRNQLLEQVFSDINSGDPNKMHWENIFITRKDGSSGVINAVNIPLPEQNTMVSTVMDITSLHEIQKDLLKAKEKAEESDRLKSAFLANMSHEIRTPMNGILGFAELLKEKGLSNDSQQKYIGIIEKSGTRMLNIINEIIDISKIESGLMEVNIIKTNIFDQCEILLNFFRPDAENKGIELRFITDFIYQDSFFMTDAEKLYAILTNLIKNAIKYSDTGSVEFGYNTAIDGNGIKFYVKDTGIGIPLERQEAIFERFIQAEISDLLARQGAGLGLAISKSYVKLLHGSMGVESVPGEGSCFYFTIPCQKAEEKVTSVNVMYETPENAHWDKKLKILIVEDDEASDQLLSILLESLSEVIIHANSGLDCLEICKNNPDIDLIFMDIQIPGINGYEATRKIREFNRNVVIIAQTAYAQVGDRQKVLEAGCNDYISKPLNKENLLSIISTYFLRE